MNELDRSHRITPHSQSKVESLLTCGAAFHGVSDDHEAHLCTRLPLGWCANASLTHIKLLCTTLQTLDAPRAMHTDGASEAIEQGFTTLQG